MNVLNSIEMTISSGKSWDDAIQHAIKEASKLLKDVNSLSILEQHVFIEKGKITEYIIRIKINSDDSHKLKSIKKLI